MKLTEKIAYMKGLFAGMELDGSTKEGKAILQLAEVVEEMGAYIEDLQSQVDEVTELAEILDEDLGEVEADLYEEEDDDEEDDEPFDIGKVLPPLDLDDDDDDDDEDEDDDDEEVYDLQYSVSCPSCKTAITINESVLEEGSMTCPICGEELEFNYRDIEAEFAEDATLGDLDENDEDTDEIDDSDSDPEDGAQ